MHANLYIMAVVIILAVVALLVLLFKVWHKHKTPKVGSLALVTGGVKTGKTTFAVHLALKNYRRNVVKYYIVRFFCKIFRKPLPEKPLLYSNIPLTVPYVPVTQSMLLRKVRFNYKSVILLSEASLVADSQLIQDKERNDDLLLFVKLIAHETRGGMLVLDTQSIGDLHYSFKRCLSEYFYIHHIFKWCPFFIIAWIEEQRYSDDGTVISAQTEDVEENLKWFLIPKSTWKKFDTYTYSAMTDDLDVTSKTCKCERGHLKTIDIVSFRDRRILKAGRRSVRVSSSKSGGTPVKCVPIGTDVPVTEVKK